MLMPAVANTLGGWVLRALRRKLQRQSADLVALVGILEAALPHDRPCCNMLRRCTELRRTRCSVLQCVVLCYTTLHRECDTASVQCSRWVWPLCAECCRARVRLHVLVRVRGCNEGLQSGEYVP
jgi:hypothetical protein